MPQFLSKSDFDRLFVLNEKAFRYYARTLLPHWDAVDEVLQLSSLIMWKKIEQVDSDDGFRVWGKCIVRFEAQKYCRTRARDLHVFDPDLLALLEKHQDEDSPEPDLDRDLAALESCMKRLGDANRKLVLAPYRGHGVLTQLAEASGRTRNSLYKQIRRLRTKLESCVTMELSRAKKS